MAQILHCDCCKKANGFVDENSPGLQAVKVWHAVTFHGHTIDICTTCLEKVEAILGFKFEFEKLKGAKKLVAPVASNLECGKCHHKPHKPGDCEERICDAAGDMDYCPC